MSPRLRATTSDNENFIRLLGRLGGRKEEGGAREGRRKKGREGRKEGEGRRKEGRGGKEEAREDTCNRQLPQARHCAKGFARVLSLNNEDSPLSLF